MCGQWERTEGCCGGLLWISLSAAMTLKAVKDVPELNLTKGGFLCWIQLHLKSDLTLNYLHQCAK